MKELQKKEIKNGEINSYENKLNLVPIDSLLKIKTGYKIDDDINIKEKFLL